MITYISKKLTDLLCSKSIIDADKAEIYQYGYEVFISGILGFIIATVIGLVSGNFIESLIFLAFFVPLRQLCGGYHADGYLKCNIVFTSIFILILLGACFIPKSFTIYIAIFCTISTLITMYILAPIENTNKPLDDEQIRLNRKKCLIITPLLSIISIAASFFNAGYSITASLTLLSVAVLMIITKFSKTA